MKISFFLTLFLFCFLDGYAQLALPYHTKFDTPAEQADWVEYRKGSPHVSLNGDIVRMFLLHQI